MIDTNWEEICKKCNEEGLPNHIDCEYYGEPNGCNSPTYGRHPAYKRELGNVQKMREALDIILVQLRNIYHSPDYKDEPAFVKTCLRSMEIAIDYALASPPRNCDVGTVTEQYKRHCRWCNKNRDNSCATVMCRLCFAKWGQMPYEKEGK